MSATDWFSKDPEKPDPAPARATVGDSLRAGGSNHKAWETGSNHKAWEAGLTNRPVPSLEICCSDGQDYLLAWFTITGCQKGPVSGGRTTIFIMTGIGRFMIALHPDDALGVWEAMGNRVLKFIRPGSGVIGIAKEPPPTRPSS